MANTTFNGPVRSENGFKTIIKNSDTGAVTSDMTLSTYSTSITVAATGTDHKETSIGMPSNFLVYLLIRQQLNRSFKWLT